MQPPPVRPRQPPAHTPHQRLVMFDCCLLQPVFLHFLVIPIICYSCTSPPFPLLLLVLSASSITALQRHAQAGRGVQWRRAPGDPRSASQFTGCQVKRIKQSKISESMQLNVRQQLVSFTILFVSCILWCEALWMLLSFNFCSSFHSYFPPTFSNSQLSVLPYSSLLTCYSRLPFFTDFESSGHLIILFL